ELRKKVEAAEDASALAVIAKRATTDFPNAGKAEDVAALIQKIGKHDQKLADGAEAVFKTMSGIISTTKLYGEFGPGRQGGAGGGDGFTDINALAQDLVNKAKAEGKTLTIEKARGIVRASNPEFAKREADARQDRIRAAS